MADKDGDGIVNEPSTNVARRMIKTRSVVRQENERRERAQSDAEARDQEENDPTTSPPPKRRRIVQDRGDRRDGGGAPAEENADDDDDDDADNDDDAAAAENDEDDVADDDGAGAADGAGTAAADDDGAGAAGADDDAAAAAVDDADDDDNENDENDDDDDPHAQQQNGIILPDPMLDEIVDLAPHVNPPVPAEPQNEIIRRFHLRNELVGPALQRDEIIRRFQQRNDIVPPAQPRDEIVAPAQVLNRNAAPALQINHPVAPAQHHNQRVAPVEQVAFVQPQNHNAPAHQRHGFVPPAPQQNRMVAPVPNLNRHVAPAHQWNGNLPPAQFANGHAPPPQQWNGIAPPAHLQNDPLFAPFQQRNPFVFAQQPNNHAVPPQPPNNQFGEGAQHVRHPMAEGQINPGIPERENRYIGIARELFRQGYAQPANMILPPGQPMMNDQYFVIDITAFDGFIRQLGQMIDRSVQMARHSYDAVNLIRQQVEHQQDLARDRDRRRQAFEQNDLDIRGLNPADELEIRRYYDRLRIQNARDFLLDEQEDGNELDPHFFDHEEADHGAQMGRAENNEDINHARVMPFPDDRHAEFPNAEHRQLFNGPLAPNGNGPQFFNPQQPPRFPNPHQDQFIPGLDPRFLGLPPMPFPGPDMNQLPPQQFPRNHAAFNQFMADAPEQFR